MLSAYAVEIWEAGVVAIMVLFIALGFGAKKK